MTGVLLRREQIPINPRHFPRPPPKRGAGAVSGRLLWGSRFRGNDELRQSGRARVWPAQEY